MKIRALDSMTESQIEHIYQMAEESRGAPLPFSFKAFSQLVHQPDMGLYVLEGQTEILAFALFRHMMPEAELYYVTVDRRNQKQGLAKTLLAGVLDNLSRAGMKNIYLEVRESNQAARKLYQTLGFQITGSRDKYYRDPDEAALLMTLDLKEGFNDKDISHRDIL